MKKTTGSKKIEKFGIIMKKKNKFKMKMDIYLE